MHEGCSCLGCLATIGIGIIISCVVGFVAVSALIIAIASAS